MIDNLVNRITNGNAYEWMGQASTSQFGIIEVFQVKKGQLDKKPAKPIWTRDSKTTNYKGNWNEELRQKRCVASQSSLAPIIQ